MGPETHQHPLTRADGSATFSDDLYIVLAGVNGPIEAQRRDELPEEAAIEVNVRQSIGTGSPKERWLEDVVHSTLKTVLLTHLHPRTLIQVTLQVMKRPNAKVPDIAVIPALLNAAMLALVDGGLPMSTTYTAVLATVSKAAGGTAVSRSEHDIANAMSMHAFAFNGHDACIMNESAGKFSMDTWEAAHDVAQKACKAAIASTSDDKAMVDGAEESEPWFRRTLENKVREECAWRDVS